jgi:hypothetical protein
MSGQVYRSAMGKKVDMGEMRLKNEMVRAVGNMKVNARGDLLDDSNKIISPKNKQISRQVKREVKFNEDSNNNM